MRRFTALRAAVCALVALLIAPAVHAQAVRDSVKITVFSTYDEFITRYGGSFGQPVYYVGTCHFQVLGMWPDVLTDQGLPRSYGVVRTAAGSTDRLQLSGLHSPPNASKFVPDGFQGIGSNLYGTSSWAVSDPYPNYAECSRRRGDFAAWAAGAGEWYAVYTLPNGMPLALFTHEATGLRVAFDGSFESKQSREVDASAPGGKRPVVAYAWAFGDGQSGSGARPTHVYADSGRYSVTLTVTDDDGQIDTYTREVRVQKPGLVVWAERTPGEREHYRREEEVLVTTFLDNQSDETIYDVRVPLNHGFVSTFPDSLLGTSLKTNPVYKRVGQAGKSDTTIAQIGPGERAEFVTRYRVHEYANYRGPTYYEAATVKTFATLYGVTAVDALRNAVKVEEKCAPDVACGEDWTVGPTWTVVMEYRTDNAPTTQAFAGVRHNPALRSAELRPFNFPTVQPFTYAYVDGTLTRFCHTACADVRVTVTDTLTGLPVEGAKVTLTPPKVAAPANVTPDHSGGHLCYRGTGRMICSASAVVLTTDDKGEVNAYYSFPGLAEPADVAVSAQTRGTGGLVIRDQNPTLRLLPSERTDAAREIVIGPEEQTFLNHNKLGYLAGYTFNSMGETCEGIGKLMLADVLTLGQNIRPSTSSIPLRTANLLAEWLCTLNPITIWGQEIGGTEKKLAEVMLISWFTGRLDPPDAGLGTVNGPYPGPPPLPFIFYYDGDYYGAVLESALASASGTGTGPGGTARLELFETSWLQMEGLTSGNPYVANAYFRYTYTPAGGGAEASVEKRIEYGYDAETWMSPANTPELTTSADAGDERLTVGPSAPAPVRLAGDEAALAASAVVAADSTIKPGDFLFLEAPGGSFELNQVRTVESGSPETGYTVALVRPLQASYGVGSTVQVRADSATVAPPIRPMLATADSVSTTAPTTLRWASGAYQMVQNYDVQVARDTLFASPLHDLRATTATSLDVGTLANGEALYWRARSRNLVGTGEWSRAMRVVGSDAVPTAVEQDEAPLAEARLEVPYPNPSRATATLRYALPRSADVRLIVYDVLGREVARVVEGMRSAGTHAESLPVSSWPSGLYVVRLVTEGAVQTQPFTVVR